MPNENSTSGSLLEGQSPRGRMLWIRAFLASPMARGNLWALQGTVRFLQGEGASMEELREAYKKETGYLYPGHQIPDLDTLLAAHYPNPNRGPEEAEVRR